MSISYQTSDNEDEVFEKPISGQLPIYTPSYGSVRETDSLRQELASMDISKITPLEAMNILYSFIEKAKGEK